MGGGAQNSGLVWKEACHPSRVIPINPGREYIGTCNRIYVSDRICEESIVV